MAQQQLKLVFLNGTNCSSEFQELYQKAYAHWKEVWKSTFLELDGSADVFSDNFTRQDEILAVFCESECIALVCNRYIDLTLKSHFDDTYFNTWPRDVLESLSRPHGLVAIGNQISIDPRFRKLEDGTAMKDILMWLYHRRQKAENVDLTLGAVREDKGLDKLFEKFGAEIIKPNVSQHNVNVALIAIWKDKIVLDKIDLPQMWMETIYKNKIEDRAFLRKSIGVKDKKSAA